MNNQARWTPLIGLFLLLAMVAWMASVFFNAQGKNVSWSELKEQLREGEGIEKVILHEDKVQIVLETPEGRVVPDMVQAMRVDGDDELIQILNSSGVAYEAAPNAGCEGGEVGLLLIPLGLLLIFWLFIANRSAGGQGVAAFGRSQAKLVPEDGTGVSFEDVAGVDEAAEELREVVAFLQTPERFTRLGGRPPKGVLLVGPPGTGKTLLARAVAGEAGVPFFSISGSDFVEMFVGVGASRVRDLFKNAIEHAPCIIFIDELDAVGKSRGAGGPAGNEEREQTLNQLLVEMDGFDNRKGVIVMAATNRPEILDQALLRAGRFDRQVLVDRPDRAGRKAVLEVHAKNIKLSEDIDMMEIAKLTPGFAGADLANALNEAALLGARRDADAISMGDIKEAIERVIAGLEKKNRRMSAFEIKNTAYHEVGHALCAAASPGGDPVQKISIIPRGLALGYTLTVPAEDRYSKTKAELLNQLTMLYGGRAAEDLIFGDVTTGAADDIRRATNLARDMVVKFGMSKALGAVNFTDQGQNMFGLGPNDGLRGTSPDTLDAIEQEIRRLTDRAYGRAIDILTDNRVLLEEMAIQLLDTEILEGDELQNFLSRAVLAESFAEPPTAEWLREVAPEGK